MLKFQPLLKEQSSVKVVLNGGQTELASATVPFTIGISDEIAEQLPTHVLVIDMHDSLYSFREEDAKEHAIWDLQNSGIRQIFELDKINFLQFKKSGNHNLIFVLLTRVTKSTKKFILQHGYIRSRYENNISLHDVEDFDVYELGIVGYCENLVEVPEVFFAERPTRGIKKVWHSWVNLWYLTDPVDECDFRKRVIPSIFKIIPWLLVFLLRFIVATLYAVIAIVIVTFMFLCGVQIKNSFPAIARLYKEFVFLYPRLGWKNIRSVDNDMESTKEMKIYEFGRYTIHIPISPIGVIIQIFFWWLFVKALVEYIHIDHLTQNNFLPWVLSVLLSIPIVWHLWLIVFSMPYKKVDDWFKNSIFVNKYDDDEPHTKNVWKTVLVFSCVPIGCFLYKEIPWKTLIDYCAFAVIFCGKFIYSTKYIIMAIVAIYFFVRNNKKITRNIQQFNEWMHTTKFWKLLVYFDSLIPTPVVEEKVIKPMPVIVSKKVILSPREEKVLWFKYNMSINTIPDKVDITDVVAPTKAGSVVQKFKVSFWTLKAKVCKPYAK